MKSRQNPLPALTCASTQKNPAASGRFTLAAITHAIRNMKDAENLRRALGLMAFAPMMAVAAPNNVVISGFQVRGPAGGNDEYVELRNVGTTAVSIGGWKLMGCQSGSPGTASLRATITTGVTLQAGQYYLLANTSTSGYSYTSVTPDQTYSSGFSDFTSTGYAGIQLQNASSVVQDGVGATLSPCREGTGIVTPTTSANTDAYARNNSGATDTGNNATDFAGPQLWNPHNSSGAGGQACTNSGIHIYAIQGASQVSPYKGLCVAAVPGIVTAVTSTGFYMQDGDGDGNTATSDGVFVYTKTAPAVNVGAQVNVDGTVTEYSSGTNNTTVTEISTPTVVVSSGLFTNTTIQPTVIGAGGRIPPDTIIDNDTSGSVLVASQTTYDPAQDGIDFYESLEGMLVQVNNARVVGPTNKYGEIWLVGDNGAYASGNNSTGGLTITSSNGTVDFNPERVMVDVSGLTSTYPQTNVGDMATTVNGVMGYDYGDFRIYATTLPSFTSGGLTPTPNQLPNAAGKLSIATYNISNFNVNESDICDGVIDQAIATGRMAKIVNHIVSNLASPAILSLEEVQDNDGCTDDGVVAADVTLSTLIQAIAAAGGPNYQWLEIDPVNDADGGLVGGNIRQALLYDTSRVTYVPGTVGVGNSTTGTALGYVNNNLVLTLSPGRIDPTNAAWSSSRKPLAATFDVNGRRVIVVSNHFNSKGGDQPLFGQYQPPATSSATQRTKQAQEVHDFVAQALSLDPNARVVVLGDLNDYTFSTPLLTLSGDSVGTRILTDLSDSLLTPVERFGYVYEGNSEELDHIYVSNALLPGAQFQSLHVNAEFADGASDHDPLLASLGVAGNQAPVVVVAPVADVTASTLVTLDGSGSYDNDGSISTYAWTQTAGSAVTLSGASSPTATFQAPASAGPMAFTLTVTDNEGAQSSASVAFNVVVPNQAPTANAGADQSVPTLASVTLNGTGSSDADGSIASYSWTQVSGTPVTLSGANSATPSFTAPTKATTLTFQLTVTDDKGATASATVNVVVNNQAPTANAGTTQNVNTLAPVTLNGTASSDVDGSIASYKWTQVSGTPVTLTADTTATPTFVAPTTGGALVFELTVTDDAGATASATVTINVANQPPVANAGSDQTVKTLSPVSLNGSASSDVDGSIASYAWTQVSGTPVSLAGASTATPSFTAPSTAGTLTFQLTVTDNSGATASATVNVNVQNQAPVANAGSDQTVKTLSPVSLNGSASSDVDGSIASYAWTQVAGTPVSLAGASTATPSFTAPSTAGTLTFQLTVTDNSGATASTTVNVFVQNQGPVANAGQNQSVPTTALVVLDGTSSYDVDGSIASYTWVQTSGPAVNLANANTATPSFTAPSSPASLSFQLTVTDNSGAQATASVTVTVNNQVPVANAGPDQNAAPRAKVYLDGSSSKDPDGSIVSYQWVQTAGTAVTLKCTTSVKANFKVPRSATGVLSFKLTVTDNLGASSSDNVDVYVNALKGALADGAADDLSPDRTTC